MTDKNLLTKLVQRRIIMIANIGALYGAQIFQAQDAPRYYTAFSVCLGIIGAALVLSATRYGYDVYQKRKHRREATSAIDVETQQ